MSKYTEEHALRALEQHRKVVNGYSPTPSLYGHHRIVEEALSWALDELAQLREDHGVSTEEAPATETDGLDKLAENDNPDQDDEAGDE